jgi:hypothetical protein
MSLQVKVKPLVAGAALQKLLLDPPVEFHVLPSTKPARGILTWERVPAAGDLGDDDDDDGAPRRGVLQLTPEPPAGGDDAAAGGGAFDEVDFVAPLAPLCGAQLKITFEVRYDRPINPSCITCC